MLQLDLSGKIAVVTGASGDLGRVMVRTLAKCGADVAIHYNKNLPLKKWQAVDDRPIHMGLF
ncbi:MAG: hypothetical protein QGG54_17890, partial [Gammaproteobacteria bacterium]|nr:hypothetical protein [Gammaproteobacteria bacterium]